MAGVGAGRAGAECRCGCCRPVRPSARSLRPGWRIGAPLWLLDEPLNGLDEDGRGAARRAIAAHRQGGGAVLVAATCRWRRMARAGAGRMTGALIARESPRLAGGGLAAGRLLPAGRDHRAVRGRDPTRACSPDRRRGAVDRGTDRRAAADRAADRARPRGRSARSVGAAGVARK